MFERIDSKPPNGEMARITLPPPHEFLVSRSEKHGGSVLIKCHALGLGKGGALVCYVFSASIDPKTGEPVVDNRVSRIFSHFNDVQEIDIPEPLMKH